MEDETWDVVVVGGGAAGLSAALMLGRARRRVLVLDAGSPRNRFAAHMHGVLGHDGLDPLELLARGRAEVAAYGVEVRPGTVDHVTQDEDGVTVEAGEDRHRARALVVATGARDELPDVPGLPEHWGTGVLHCPYCHGWEVRDQRLAVIVSAPGATHQAELVRQWSDRLTVVVTPGVTIDDDVRRRLLARGADVVDSPVVEVAAVHDEVRGARIDALVTQDGKRRPVDAVFAATAPRPVDGFLDGLRLARSVGPTGDVLDVDANGRTSSPRVWAVGNVVEPHAPVPVAAAAGTRAGAQVNGVLVEQDAAAALSAHDPTRHAWPDAAPASFWEERYAGSERIWSGRPNAALVAVAATLTPGRSLDLGCGEGADVVWLAQQGWRAAGVDISPTAVDRGRQAARALGVPDDRIEWTVADLSAWHDEGAYDLVSASFLHSPVTLDRTTLLRRAAARVAPGGRLLVVSHAAAPPWAGADAHEHHFLTPDEEVAELALDADRWEVELAEVRARRAVGPDGREAELDDGVLVLRRR
ncbi:bifunctional NAD(P)/FAD-dependent oxidoreductase/class I SAM-dependent methyltransferase [Cellulomonas composti]|uniref:Methyltransferase n=1 Tax=Cellulomonas composti TaxID=266130 RepID=A0A511J6G0_9CELL|nr:bifunctional NAD(P)/FAD-dependent oxidoreductase/class I SAM-dependent methyltransferase [Cellulomonas composti]GEL93581.1 methyltransferase [Cellulomonas composti]